ncbi:hypothetical protein [Streptomyces sp. S186]|uniref:hypothetical protein n=1 Tax=Streptomyces sp. S186 TaxID=3434395 RepID=UPI003F66D40A
MDTWAPLPSSDGTAAYFDAANRSERGLALDLADPGDAAAAAVGGPMSITGEPGGTPLKAEAQRVPCGPVNSLSEALELAARPGLDPVVPVGPGRIPQVTGPLRLSGTPVVQPTAPSGLDEDGTALRTWLSGPGDRPLPPRM